ncbi:MAG: RNA helicase [Desulfobacteraceae bacterium]|nr:RNA helicase [Desulfobacteraceae bacterium]
MAAKKSSEKKRLKCGLIMPISGIDGCSAEHWLEVKEIFTESVHSIDGYEFNVQLVSDAENIGIIQKNIVENTYTSDIVICDVSCKNPNVMFELGMRLAFDKATIIVKDDKTGYSFDTGIIEHIEYPRDLRFAKIVKFKKKLSEKVAATYKESITNSDYSTFLKNLGKFKVVDLESEKVSLDDKMFFNMLTAVQDDIKALKNRLPVSRFPSSNLPFDYIKIKVIDDVERENIPILRQLIIDFMANNPIPPNTSLDENTLLWDYLNKNNTANLFSSESRFRKITKKIIFNLIIEGLYPRV